ncbi:MAG: methyltransferase, partial [Sandaracinaceae bacterium]
AAAVALARALARVALACGLLALRAVPVAGLGGLVLGALVAAPPVARVWIEGPAFVDVTRWASPGEEVPAHRARWLLRNVDGLAVGGSRLTVRTDPPLRPGRGASRRGERSERRRALFSRWDEGVQVDDEGLLSLTPEALALEIARGARGVVIDGTAGVGGLTIAFARQPEVHRVVAVDRDRARLARAMHNARIYGVHAKVTAVPGDLLAHLGALRGDLLVVDPPWGGRGYDREHVGVEDLGLDLRSVLARWSGPMVLKLPRSFDVGQLEGFRVSAAIDARGILKFLIARRP